MFYTEYRPQKFKDVIGNQRIVESITNALSSDKLPHAYFFSGGRGTGKTTTARLIAKSLNCESLEKASDKDSIKCEPCGSCNNCKYVHKGNHPDLVEIDAASNRGIDNIRELTDTIKLSAAVGRKKIYIIDEVHMLTTEASNALLKTLEEPPAHVYFMMCTTNPEKVLNTIKSRCIQYNFKNPNINQIIDKLKLIVEDKNLNITDEHLKKIAINAKGAFRDAETLLEQYANVGGYDEILGLEETFDNFLILYSHKDAGNLVKLINDIFHAGVNIEHWVIKFLEYLRAIALVQLGVDMQESAVPVQNTEVVNVCSIQELNKLINRFKKIPSEFKSTVYPTFPIEIAIIELTGIDNEGSQVKLEKPTKSLETKFDIENVVKKVKTDDKNIVVKTKIKDETKNEVDEKEDAKADLDFPYNDFLNHIKDKHHSIFLTLKSCRFVSFDGRNLNLGAKYSFHKERILTHKNRTIIENTVKDFLNRKVNLNCEILNKKDITQDLSDKNIVQPTEKIEKIFEDVFGDELLAEE